MVSSIQGSLTCCRSARLALFFAFCTVNGHSAKSAAPALAILLVGTGQVQENSRLRSWKSDYVGCSQDQRDQRSDREDGDKLGNELRMESGKARATMSVPSNAASPPAALAGLRVL